MLNQAANAAGNAKDTIFAIVYRRLVPRLGHAQAIGTIDDRFCRLIWKILHKGIRYEERGSAVNEEAKKVRRKMIRELRSFGYRVKLAQACRRERLSTLSFSTCALRTASGLCYERSAAEIVDRMRVARSSCRLPLNSGTELKRRRGLVPASPGADYRAKPPTIQNKTITKPCAI